MGRNTMLDQRLNYGLIVDGYRRRNRTESNAEIYRNQVVREQDELDLSKSNSNDFIENQHNESLHQYNRQTSLQKKLSV